MTERRLKATWKIIDNRTGRRITVAAFFTEERARGKIAEWRVRQAKGVRPDVSLADIDAMEPRLLWDQKGEMA